MNTKINNSVFSIFPVLETERLILRDFSYSDTHDLYLIRSNPKVMEFMDSHTHQSLSDSSEMIALMLDSFMDETGINWAIENKYNGKMIGYIGYWRMMPEHVRAEIGYALKPPVWGKGYMKEALWEVLQFGFEQLKLHSVEANVNPGNLASARLLKSLGFKAEGHFKENYFFDGHFFDSDIYSLLETDFQPYAYEW
jgi:[ribosomal protein S5]-alanine N-acetyltransferase